MTSEYDRTTSVSILFFNSHAFFNADLKIRIIHVSKAIFLLININWKNNISKKGKRNL